MLTSESIKELATALAKAQGEISNPAKNKSNPAFKGAKYADLSAIIDAMKKPLAQNGLSFVQFPVSTERQEVGVTTRLMHASGEWIEATYCVPVVKNDAQGFGSALTYARRYSLSAVAGLAADDDDDGNAAANAAKPIAPVPAKLSEKARADMDAYMDEATSVEDLKERTKKAFALASQGGDDEAFKHFQEHSLSVHSKKFAKAA